MREVLALFTALALTQLGCSCDGRARRDAGNVEGTDAPVPLVDGGPVDAPGARDVGTGNTDGGVRVDVGPSGTPASIEIYSGDGLMMPQGWPAGDTLKAIVLDAAGRPVIGAAVDWLVTAGGIAIGGDFATGTSGTSRTDERGIARATVRGEFGASMSSVLASTVRASIASGSVEFHVFCSYSPMSSAPSSPAAYVMVPEGRDFGTVERGSTLSSGLEVQVVNMWGTEMGRGLMGVGVRFLPTDPGTDAVPTVSCANATVGVRAGGTVFTDATGRARCDVRVPDALGTYSLGVRVGGATDFIPFTMTVR